MSAGVYIHIPFCKSRCSYCDFATDVYTSGEAVERYVKALIQEIRRSQDTGNGRQETGGHLASSLTTDHSLLASEHGSSSSVFSSQFSSLLFDTIYFGGGTPSLLSADQLARILETVNGNFDISADPEVTLEMNPGTVSLEQLKEFRSLGVNRASFGVQTFDDRSLKLLARGHDAGDARTTFDLLRKAGFDNVSFDLIAGLPHQTLKDWRKNLEEAVSMSPEHISLYLLEIHEGTPLAEQVRTGRQPQPDEVVAAEMYELMLEHLANAGYEQYEISNFSKPGYESRHNLKYWELDPVIGFGVSAHSFDGVRHRWSNVRDTNLFVELIENGSSPVADVTNLTDKQRSGEYAFLKLRLNKGLELREYENSFGERFEAQFASDLNEFKKDGLIEITPDHLLRLTPRGRVFSNEVFRAFV